jgi:small-conductance mechanosensitive channel
LAKLKAIPDIIRKSIEEQEKVRFDRAHFKSYGAFSLDFEYVYYVQESDYTAYMDVQEKINLAIFEKFEAENIAFAYPTQTLYVSKTGNSAS